MSSAAGTARGLRDKPLGRIAILVVVLLAAFLVARSCGSSQGAVDQEQAVEIARAEVDFEPDEIQVRNVPAGFGEGRLWAVSLYTGTYSRPGKCRVVSIDSDSGRVTAVGDC